VKYNFYIVEARYADIALVPGTDKSPDGFALLQNATSPVQVGLYNLSLGSWGPGYRNGYGLTSKNLLIQRLWDRFLLA